MSLPAEEQLARAISYGHEMLSLLPEDMKLAIGELRNGAKKSKSSIPNSRKST